MNNNVQYRLTKSGKFLVCPYCHIKFSTNPVSPIMIHHETKCTHSYDGKPIETQEK